MSLADLLVTGAKVYIAPAGEALPDPNAIGVGVAWGGNWINLGELSAPLKYQHTEENYEFRTQSYLHAVKRQKTKLEDAFMSEFAEYNATNMAYALGLDPTDVITTTAAGASQIGHEILRPGSAAAACQRAYREWAIGVEGEHCLADGTRVWNREYLTKCNLMFDGEVTRDVNGATQTVLPWKAMALADPAQAGGNPYVFERMTAAATS